MGDEATRVAVVTGAAGRIGSRLLARLAEDGYEVVGLDLPEACPDDPRFLGVDITDEQAVRATFATVVERHGRIDLLFNHAGISAIGAFDAHPLATYERVMAVNYLGAVACTQAALPALRATRGRVVVTSSVAGLAPIVGRPAYVAAKHAVTGLFDALRPELARDGVDVTLVHPTFVTGGMTTDLAPGAIRTTTGEELSPDEAARSIIAGVHAGRDQVLIGRTASLAYHVHRAAPRLYSRLMARRLRS